MIWYPYVQMKNMKEPLKIIDAEGVYLYTEDKKLLDTISSWWCMIHGYKNKEINEAIKSQIDKFSHIMLGGLTHDPVQKLSQKLKEILPNDLDYCFYSDSGSVAVEVAIKMSIQYYFNAGKPEKNKIIALKYSYHGDTFKTMEIGDDSDYHLAFPNKSGVHHIYADANELEDLFKKHHQDIAAFIVEPLLQGAGGMLNYDVRFLEEARELCDKYDVLLIFDEVATGFGRTGNVFVSNLVCPDIVVLGKALTGGYIGHAVTVANCKVFNGFYSDNPEHALMHGPTFMANPLACSAALKSIEIFFRDDYLSKIMKIEEITKREFEGFCDDRINEIRIIGASMCIEVKDPDTLKGFAKYAYDKGVFSRCFLNIMYTMVPYIINEDELVTIFDVYKSWFERN